MQIFRKIPEKLLKIYENEKERLILFHIVFIALGSYFSVIFFDNINFTKIIISLAIFFFAIFLYRQNRHHFSSVIFAIFIAFFLGFNFSYFNQKIINNYTKITGKIFVNVEANVKEVNNFKNKANGQEGLSLLLEDLVFSQSKYEAKSGAKFEAKEKNKAKKSPKITEKYIHKNFMNVKDFQEIDSEFISQSKNYQEVKWVEKNGENFYPNPPKKIRIFATKFDENLKIGDRVFFKALIMPIKRKEFIGSFDFAFNALSKSVAGQGYAISQVEIVSEVPKNSVDNFFENLRKKIQAKILIDEKNVDQQISAALLMGNQNLIDKDAMVHIRNSGLAHLISISGLHLSLAAGIFFFSIRFLLSRSQYLALNFDIKKIAAIFAIISSYFYLKIAGSPIPAVRSFIAVLFVMIAILFDRKIDSLRVVAFGALIVIFISPYNMFSASFQLSFAAILSIIVFHEIWINFYKNKIQNHENEAGKTHKFCKYFFEMVLISCVAQLANTPFLIYHFSDVSIYGAISNLLAIPLTSYTTMPLGFASFLLMPFGLEQIVLVPMNYSVSWVVKISQFVADLQNSHFYVPQMPKSGMVLAIFGGLIFAFLKTKYLRIFGLFLFLFSIATISFVKQPSALIDGDARFFALYDKNKGLVFSKKMRDSKKVILWREKMNEKKFKSFDDHDEKSLINQGVDCYQEMCEINLEKYFFDNKNFQNKKILILFERNKVSEICSKNYDLIVNLTKKYKLPKCAFKTNVIDNSDLLQNGAHFIYFDKNGLKIENIS